MSIWNTPPPPPPATPGAQVLSWVQPDRRISPELMHRAIWAMAKARGASSDEGRAYGFLAARVKTEGQTFEFGRVPENLFKAEAIRGGEIMCKGFLNSPFRTCIYWHDYVVEDGTDFFGEASARYCTTFTRISEPGEHPEFLVLDCAAVPNEIAHALGVTRKLVGHEQLFCATAFGTFTPREHGGWGGRELDGATLQSAVAKHTGNPLPEGSETLRLATLADSVVGMSMILATKNIGLRTEVPDRKLQQKRAKQGKPPLPTVTYVDMQRWLAARHNTLSGGTHASPVPHLRRGHIRTYQTGKQVWIRDMLVNATSLAEVAKRDHYEVEEHDE